MKLKPEDLKCCGNCNFFRERYSSWSICNHKKNHNPCCSMDDGITCGTISHKETYSTEYCEDWEINKELIK